DSCPGTAGSFRAFLKKAREGNRCDHYGNVSDTPPAQALQAAVRLPEASRDLHRRASPENQKLTDEEWLAKVLDYDRQLQKSRESVPVHMLDIHLEKGMHCVDCHFVQDVHGNTKLYGEVRAAIEITCVDCHGTAAARAELRTLGPSAPARPGGRARGPDLRTLRTPSGKRRFEVRGNRIYQNSMVEPDLSWPVVQVADTIDPVRPEYNVRSALAKTIRM